MTEVMSDAHVSVMRELERRGLGVMEEIDFPPYRVDIYLPDYHAVVEVDGPQHEVRADRVRDQALRDTYWLMTFRVEAAYAGAPNRWWEDLLGFLHVCALDAGDRWERCRDRTPWL